MGQPLRSPTPTENMFDFLLTLQQNTCRLDGQAPLTPLVTLCLFLVLVSMTQLDGAQLDDHLNCFDPGIITIWLTD